MNIKDTNYDYAVLGSSRANGSFIIFQLDSSTQLHGINIASNGSGYVDNFLVLYKFLYNNNSVKYLFLQTDIYSLDPERNFSNGFHIYNFLPYWNEKEYRDAIFHYLDKKDNILMKYFPWARFYKYNKYFSPFEVIKRLRSAYNNSNKLKDIPEEDKIAKNSDSSTFYKSPKSKKVIIEPFDVSYLIKTIELAQKNNIQVICYTAPDFYFQDSIFTNYRFAEQEFISLLERKDVTYIPQPKSLRKNVQYFIDPAHLSDEGKIAFTKYFADQFNKLKH